MADTSRPAEACDNPERTAQPANTIVQVSSLYSKDAMIEIEAIAVADDAVYPSCARGGQPSCGRLMRS